MHWRVVHIYSAKGSISFNLSRWCVVKACRYCVTVLLDISERPSVSEWKAIDIRSFVCSRLPTSWQKFDVKCTSRSLTISHGTLWRRTMASRNICANLAAPNAFTKGIRYARLAKWWTNVTMQSFPFSESGISMMKSMPILSQWPLDTSNGLRRPMAFLVL